MSRRDVRQASATALCAETDPELFYPPPFVSALTKRAKWLCARCPLLEGCREFGIRHEHWGVWGGLTPEERATERRRRGITLATDYETREAA